jgi:hypothetical protein
VTIGTYVRVRRLISFECTYHFLILVRRVINVQVIHNSDEFSSEIDIKLLVFDEFNQPFAWVN